jgi:hypothetical protein
VEKRKRARSVEVMATDREWMEFRKRVLGRGKTVKGVFRELVVNYGKKAKRVEGVGSGAGAWSEAPPGRP